MTSQVSCWLLLHLAIFLIASLVQSREGASYQDFANRHIDYPKTRVSTSDAYCDLMMARRGMTRGVCKPYHTFINGREGNIKNICHSQGTRVNPRQNLYKSKRPFYIVTCQNVGRYPKCSYIGSRSTRRISVACENSLPVQFVPRYP